MAHATLWMVTDKDQKVRKASDSPMPKEGLEVSLDHGWGPPAALARLEEKDKLGRWVQGPRSLVPSYE